MQDAMTAPSLGEAYREHFLIGAAANAYMLRDEQYRRLQKKQRCYEGEETEWIRI